MDLHDVARPAPAPLQHKRYVAPAGAWHNALWLAQLALAGVFVYAAYLHTTRPVAELALRFGWPGDIPVLLLRFIGTMELLGAVGLVLPALSWFKPKLTPLAALGLSALQLCAIAFHLFRAEYGSLPVNAALAALAAFVAWGRFKKAPVAPPTGDVL